MQNNLINVLFEKNKEYNTLFQELPQILNNIQANGTFQNLAEIILQIYNNEKQFIQKSLTQAVDKDSNIDIEREVQLNQKVFKNNFKLIVSKLIDDIWTSQENQQETLQPVEDLPSKTQNKDNRFYSSIVNKLQESSNKKKQKQEKQENNKVIKSKNELEKTSKKRPQSLTIQSQNQQQKSNKIQKLIEEKYKDLDSEFLYNQGGTYKFGTSKKELKLQTTKSPGPALYSNATTSFKKRPSSRKGTFGTSKKTFYGDKFINRDTPGPIYTKKTYFCSQIIIQVLNFHIQWLQQMTILQFYIFKEILKNPIHLLMALWNQFKLIFMKHCCSFALNLYFSQIHEDYLDFLNSMIFHPQNHIQLSLILQQFRQNFYQQMDQFFRILLVSSLYYLWLFQVLSKIVYFLIYFWLIFIQV